MSPSPALWRFPWRPLSVVLLVALTVPLLAPAGAQTEGTRTDCSGGASDPRATNTEAPLDLAEEFLPLTPPLKDPKPYDIWVSKVDMSLWEDSNGVPRIQRTARECYVTDVDGTVVSSYIDYVADERLM